ncbi:ATP-dependent nuclease [Sulfitobacter sp.]|uniref:ATP-dependent nuclease n=1 Tax=Sulfitobacter sp. TaxID=1903071 RepID=UPI003EF282A3
MIETLDFNCGPTVGASALQLPDLDGLTVFVGPNNCGKSALIQSLHSSILGKGLVKESALKSVGLRPLDNANISLHPDFKDAHAGEQIKCGGQARTLQQWTQALQQDWNGQWGGFYRAHYCAQMNGPQRLSMLPEENSINLLKPVGPLARLFVDDPRRESFQKAVFAGIEQYPVIDHVSKTGTFCLAFSSKKTYPAIERSMDAASIDFFGTVAPRESLSDGFNAYVGLLGTLFATEHRTILVDEPEAFLHPSLARTLGKQVAAHSNGKQVFVATHSADFLMGAIESGVNIRIVRLQYQDGTGFAHLLENDELRAFMTDPILRSANVLSGLFARSVVVTEADTDRSFYEEVNTRLLSKNDPRAVKDARFLNAQNKQTVARIVRLLRRMGIPTAGIVDLDVLSEGGTNWTRHIDAIKIPTLQHTGLGSTRSAVFKHLQDVSTDNDKKNYKVKGGISLLDCGGQEAALNLTKQLSEYGLFVVEGGEVEQWLSRLNVPQSKNRWLHSIFDAMGSDASSPDYVQPTDGDVWDFIGNLAVWFNNKERKGLS